MINITEKEFEQKIQEVIEGKKSRTKLTEELKTDWRTLNKKIQLMSIYNPELYQQFIEKCPYKPREITEIPLKTMLYEFLKTGIRMQDLADKYGIGERTLRRKIDALKKSDNPEDREMYEIVKQTAYNRAHGKVMPLTLQYRIDILEIESEEIKQNDVEKRINKLLKIEKQFNELCTTMPKKDAAKAMGYTYHRIYKLLQELYCIQIQVNTKKFREQYKVETKQPEIKTTTRMQTEITLDKEREQ